MSENPGSLNRAKVEARKFLLVMFRSLFQMFRSLFQNTPLKQRTAISGGALVLIATTMWEAVVGTAKLRRSGDAATEALDFNRDILPIFRANCA